MQDKLLKPWRAKKGECYYALARKETACRNTVIRIPFLDIIKFYESDSRNDDDRYDTGNYFRTREELENYLKAKDIPAFIVIV